MKCHIIRKTLCGGLALLLTLSLPIRAFADTWYLENGDVSVKVDDQAVQTVSQGDVSQPDSAPVITNSDPGTATSNTVVVDTAPGQTAEFTIQDVNIDTGTEDKSAIEVGDASAVITVEGTNTINQTGLTNGESAAVHVSSGNLTIQGDASDGSDKLTITSVNTAIGSNDEEDMSGNIGIDGEVSIKIDNRWPGNPYGNKGSGIGSGENADVSGTITIKDGDIYVEQNNNSVAIGANKNLTGEINISGGTTYAVGGGNSAGIGANGNISGTVNITGGEVVAGGGWYSAGIGTGDGGEITGAINISGGEIQASGTVWGAAIGTGENGDLHGEINITGGEVRAFGGSYAAGIGTGEYGYMDGNINITGGTVEASGAAAGIGTGEYGTMNGVIDISGGTVDAESRYTGAGIGAAQGGYLKGTIIIQGDAEVIAKCDEDSAAIGIGLTKDYSGGSNMTGSIQILDYAKVTTSVRLDIPYVTQYEQGSIGRGYPVGHDNPNGQFIVSTASTINGVVNPTSAEDLDAILTFHKDADGNPTNLTFVGPSSPEEKPGEIPGQTSAESVAERISAGTAENSVVTGAKKWNYTLFQVLDREGKNILHTSTQNNGILTISVETDYAQLLVYGGNLKALMGHGVKEIIFETNGGVSQYDLSQVYSVMPSGTSRLTHDGGNISFTLNHAEHGELLKE